MSKQKKGLIEKLKDKQAAGARRTVLEELFNDFHRNRKQIFVMNFFRGIFFGLGSVLGGTIVVALAVWLLSLFVEIPVIGGVAEEARQSIQADQ